MRHPFQQFLRALPIAAALAFVAPLAMPTVVDAQSVDQQRKRVQEIVDELERLAEQTNKIAEDYVEAIDTKGQLDVEIVDAEARLAEKEVELGKLREDLGEMARRSFVGGGSVPLGPLFEDSTNLNDAVKREELARVALDTGDVTTDELDEFVREINTERDDLDNKRQQAEDLAATLEAAKGDTEAKTSEYNTARADAEAKLGQLIEEEELRRAAESARKLAEEAAAAEAAAAAQAAAAQQQADNSNNSNSNTNSGGGNSGGNTSSGSSSGGNNSGGSNSGGSNSGGGNSGGDSSGGNTSSGSSGGNSSGGGNSGGNSSGGNSSGGSSGGGGSAPAPNVSSRSGIAVQAAMAQQGVPYVYATSKPGVSFDCSGLTAYAWGKAGVGLPHQSRMQYASVPHVPSSQAQPGDLIFFYSPISHVSIYIGNGMQVHAPSTGKTVSVVPVNWGKVVGVGRPG